MKWKRLGWGVVAVVFAFSALFLLKQCAYIVEPGLRDIHIRRNIKTLTKAECVEIVKRCEALYQTHSESLSDHYDEVISTDIPAAAARVGYKNAVVSKGKVAFIAGAGGFSQIGYIVIICWMDPATKRATYLALDDGRMYEPSTDEFVER